MRWLMRADREPDQDGVPKRNLGVGDFLHVGAVPCEIHVNSDAGTDQLHLERRRTVEREIEGVGVFALLAPPLKSGHAVAVDHDVGVGRIGVQRLADHDAGLAMVVALTKKSYGGGDAEVAGDLAPDILELILLGPDVGARAGDLVLTVGRAKLGGAFDRRTADVAGIGEDAQVPVWAKAEATSRQTSISCRNS